MSDGAKIAFGALAAFIGLILIGVVLQLTGVYVFGGVQRSTAEYRGKTDVIEKTQADGDYRIASYELFYNRCNSITATQQIIKNLKNELKTDPDNEWLKQTLIGTQAGLADQISDYNAEASKEGTVGQFRDSSLPYHIDFTEMDTTCGS